MYGPPCTRSLRPEREPIFSLPARPKSVNNELYGNELQCVLTQFCIFNSFSYTFSRGIKIKNPALIKDHFFVTRNSSRNIYKFIFL